MSRLLNRTFIFVSFAISLCSASPEVTSNCRDGEPGQDECASAVPSSFIQKAINQNRLRSDSASEAVRADESVLNEKVGATVGVKVAMSFWKRFGNRKHGLRSMFMSTTGHETQLKSKSFKLKFASKSERNQSQVICPMCGEQNDNASCMALCGTACSEDGTDCTECAKEHGCMDCLDCARAEHADNHEDTHEDMCPMCGKEDDNASCMALCGPACNEFGLDGTECTNCSKQHGCSDCLECHVALNKGDHEEYDEEPDGICPMCDKRAEVLCGPTCGKVGLNGTDCTECCKENGCTDCLECYAAVDHESRRPDNSERTRDVCPMCHKPGAQLCGPTCGKAGCKENGAKWCPDCTECCKENGCTDCLDCHAARDKDNHE